MAVVRRPHAGVFSRAKTGAGGGSLAVMTGRIGSCAVRGTGSWRVPGWVLPPQPLGLDQAGELPAGRSRKDAQGDTRHTGPPRSPARTTTKPVNRVIRVKPRSSRAPGGEAPAAASLPRAR